MKLHLLALSLLTAAPAALPAVAAAAPGPTTYRVEAATHTSTSEKSDATYSGRSESTWRLTRPATLTVSRVGKILRGGATLDVRGSYSFDVTTTEPARCAFTAATGSTDHGLVAPARVSLTIRPDPNAGSRILLSFTGIQASLGNPYVPSECRTSLTGEPEAEDTAMQSFPRSLLRRKQFVVVFAGESGRDGIAYRWSTSFSFRRVGR